MYLVLSFLCLTFDFDFILILVLFSETALELVTHKTL